MSAPAAKVPSRITAAKVAMASLAMLATACGGSAGKHVVRLGRGTGQRTVASGASSGRSRRPAVVAQERAALAFVDCMRSHGVPRFPDPSSTNETPSGLPKVAPKELGVGLSQFQAAETACRQLLPNGGQSTPSASQRTLSHLLQFAQCMRSHGVENWPDPIAVSAQAPPGAPPYTFDLHGLQGLDTRSFPPRVTTAMDECFRLTHLTDAEVPWSG